MIGRHGTLTGSSTVDTVTVTGAAGDNPISAVAVSIPAGTGDAYFTVAIDGRTAATPTVGGDNTYHLGVAHPIWSVAVGTTYSIQIKLISTAALTYSIHAE